MPCSLATSLWRAQRPHREAREVDRLARPGLAELGAAAEPVGHDLGARSGRPHRREQGVLGARERHVVVLEPEVAGEAAAALDELRLDSERRHDRPVRLRPEQVFEALQKALGFAENDDSIPAPAPKSAPAVQRHTGLRNMVYMAFRENPSLPFNEVTGTIPQALLMMNSALVSSYTSAGGKTILAKLLAEGRTDEQIVMALYERVLARKARLEELEICRRYLAKVENRQEALEDILWSLVNSTEFLIKK